MVAAVEGRPPPLLSLFETGWVGGADVSLSDFSAGSPGHFFGGFWREASMSRRGMLVCLLPSCLGGYSDLELDAPLDSSR